MVKVLVIGAGVAGLSAAKTLATAGIHVDVFDKGRTAGGRMATRTRDGVFNYGTQYIQAAALGNQNFRDFLVVSGASALITGWGEDMKKGSASILYPKLHDQNHGPNYLEKFDGLNGFIFQPFMSSFPDILANHVCGLGASVTTSQQITCLSNVSSKWIAKHTSVAGQEQETSPYDAVLLAVPSPQAVTLLQSAAHEYSAVITAGGVAWDPCWAVTLKLNNAPVDIDSIRIGKSENIRWASCEESRTDMTSISANVADTESRDSKITDRKATAWTLLASAAWSQAHLEDAPDDVATALAGEFAASLSTIQTSYMSARAHRWRYSFVRRPLGAPYLWDAQKRIGVCGDWCLGANVEAAFESGRQVALAMLNDMPFKLVCVDENSFSKTKGDIVE